MQNASPPISSYPSFNRNPKNLETQGAISLLSRILLGNGPVALTSALAPPSATLLERRRSNNLEGKFELDLASVRSFDATGKGWKQQELDLNLDIPEISEESDFHSSERVDKARVFLGTDLPSPAHDISSSLPGAWRGDDGKLFSRLPLPFLDSGASRESFEGLLGTRNAKEASIAARRAERAYRKDRVAPMTFPSSFFNAASKLFYALGPPGGVEKRVDGEATSERKGRIRTQRAERSMKGFDLSDKLVNRLAERLRRERREALGIPHPITIGEVAETLVRAATPMSLFAPQEQNSFNAYPTPASSPRISHLELSPLLIPIDEPPKPRLAPVVDIPEILSPFPIVDDYFALGSSPLGGRRRSSIPSILSSISSPTPAFQPLLSVEPKTKFGKFLASSFALVRERLDLIIWILIGSEGENLASVGGLFGIILHIFSFLVFVLVHTFSLVVSTCSTLRFTFYFLSWIWINLRMKTELSQVFVQYFHLCRKEWMDVYHEDNVTLGVTNTFLSLAEYAAVQAMTKDRYLVDGPGELKLLNGDVEEISSIHSKSPASLFGGLNSWKTRRRASEYLDGEGESLLVSREEDSILEGSILHSPRARIVESPLSGSYDDLPALDLNDSIGGFTFAPRRNSFRRLSELAPLSPELLPIPNIATESPLSELLRTIRRHVKLSTASYGLHTYLGDFSPSPNTFTPSTLHHRVFSHLSGIGKNASVLHVAIQDDSIDEFENSDLNLTGSYAPQFYLIRDDVHQEVIVVIRGTQSLSDIQTDLEASVVDLELPSLQSGQPNEIYSIHGGILAAARRLMSPGSSLFDKLVKVLIENPTYGVTLSGHSLGAAISSAVALIASEYILTDSELPSSGHWVTNLSCGLPPGRIIRAISFAHPTTVTTSLSIRASQGKIPLVLSIILGCDIVARMGLPQIRETRRALGRLANKRRKFLQGRKVSEHGQSEILRYWWRYKKLGGGAQELGLRGNENHEERLKEIEEIEAKAWRWRSEMDGFGDHEKRNGEKNEDQMLVPAGSCYQIDRLPIDLLEKRMREQRLTLSEEEDEIALFGLYQVGNVAEFFNLPLLEIDMISSHLPRNYLDSVEGL